MGKRTWLVCVVLAMCAGVGCSQPAAKKKAVPVAGGPAQAELGWRETSERAERAPISLTASDGSGLELVALHARTVIEDPLAFTELHLTFHNPEPRRREGRFAIALPPQAAISRFAMRVGDDYHEGEVVERRRAQQVYEDFLHRKQDPALLEKNAGNEFSARVFPIEPGADKEIILAYSEELERADQPYRLLLSGLSRLRDIQVDVRVGSSSATGRESSANARVTGSQLKLYDTDFVPQGDLEVRLPWQKAVALRSGELVLARVAPELKEQPAAIDGLTVLFDSSGSRALGYGAQVQRLGELVRALRERGSDFALRLVAFDQEAVEIYRGPASGFGEAQRAQLLERDALGATDLARALAFIARDEGKQDRVLVIGDGVITAGAEDSTALREAVAKLAAHGVQRLDVLGEGGIRDGETLTALTRAGLPGSGLVLDARSDVAELAGKLLHATTAKVDVKIAGATWVYPSTLEGLQAGDQRLVFAELPKGTPLQIELVGAGVAAPEQQEVPRPLLERAIARAKIEAMASELRALPSDAVGVREGKEREIIALSLAQRVVSDYTALLVLEGPSDYARFGIDQSALTDILRVGDEGIELVDRKQLAPKDDRLKVARRDDDLERFEAPQEEKSEQEPPSAVPAPGTAAAPIAAQEQPSDMADSVGASRHRAGAVPEGRIDADDRVPMAKRSSAAEPPPPAKPQEYAAARNAAPAGDELREADKAKADERPRFAPPPAPAPAPSAPAAVPAAEPEALAQGKGAREGEGDLASADSVGLGTSAGAGPALRGRSGGGLGGIGTGGAPVPSSPNAIASPFQLAPNATVRMHTAYGVPGAIAAQVLRSGLTSRARACYARATAHGNDRISIELSLSDKGTVRDAYVSGGSFADPRVQACVLSAARALRFPKPDNGSASVSAGVELSLMPVETTNAIADRSGPVRPRKPVSITTPSLDDAYDGVLRDVLDRIGRNERAEALTRARAAHADDPGDVVALVALGEALEATQDYPKAARAYGSIIDLFPSRADLRRMAAGRLERLPSAALALAVDSYRHAVEQRPDHPSGARSLAYAQWKQGDREGAFTTLERALDRSYPSDRFDGVDRILREDLALIGAAWLRAEPAAEARVRASLAARGIEPDHAPSLRFVLSWETDANDVDFHIYDGRGGHAYYMKPKLGSGGSLYADITTGYGPECFAIPGKSRSYPYVLQAHYFARGPMGYGMGKLQVIEHDGQGQLHFSEHPFVIMKDKAFVELARLRAPLG